MKPRVIVGNTNLVWMNYMPLRLSTVVQWLLVHHDIHSDAPNGKSRCWL